MAVIGLLGSIAGFVRVRFLLDKATIDNEVFRLHYRFTSAFFFGACVLITAFDLIGSPIDCISDDAFNRPEVLNTYCWISSTFTLPEHYDKRTGHETAHHGIGTNSRGERIYHSYYQWVPFMLFFQGILFYVPHWIWKQAEEGRIRAITDGMRGVVMCTSEERKDRRGALIDYIQQTLHTNRKYAYQYVVCEVLNFINVVGNIFFIDRFLGGAFLSFGSQVLKFTEWDQENRTDPIVKVFPRITKCTFHKYGASGTVQQYDALCVLALNILNEKIYIFLWFWLVVLAVLSGLALVYRAIVLLSPFARAHLFQRRSKIASVAKLETLVRHSDIGDFFLLLLLGKNLEGLLYKEILDDLGQRFDGEETRENSLSKDPGTLEMAPILTGYAATGR